MLYNVKAGIIGLDNLGRQYAKLIKDHVKNLNLIAASGRSQNELLYAKNELSLEYVYSDEKALFENHDIDVIFIFSEIHLRPHHAIQAIEKGKHVFMLSPLALNVEDARAVFKAADSHPSQKVMAGSRVRFFPLYQKLKSSIDNGIIGKIKHITIDSTFVNSINKRYSKPCGSIFLDTAIDEIDLCLWLTGIPIKKVLVKDIGNTYLCDATLENNSSLHLLLQPKLTKAESFLSIFGEKGQINLKNTNQLSFEVINDDGSKNEVSLDSDEQFLFSEYLQLHHFVENIMGKTKAGIKLSHAVQIMEIALAFEKSKVLNEAIEI
ncbi:MAG: Gfo/Idh/MocA family oxidoreductase [Saprospiraceae bacterium]|nr:Gfo/Idh/MocA family oxidoreductase [Bacteroidia bacterium]NNE14357.1 Gfo/Idh/MocA family oxidoreductase [Saprospiraceae bacterium]NNL92096.1 Gfo/Idh/MocA family oxidoreductase [Saprospiraceae bacterium]